MRLNLGFEIGEARWPKEPKCPSTSRGGKPERPVEWRPFVDLRRQIDRLFDDFQWGSWPTLGRSLVDMEPFWRGELSSGKAPAVDVAERDNGYEVTAELPGMDASNVEVKYADSVLTIKGEKKEEKEEKQKDYYMSERRFGSFERSFRLPDGIDADKIAANFKNGVLTVTLPRSAEAQRNEKKITVKAA
jgi:HSP20 family protein